jgi:hypothetical protein
LEELAKTAARKFIVLTFFVESVPLHAGSHAGYRLRVAFARLLSKHGMD